MKQEMETMQSPPLNVTLVSLESLEKSHQMLTENKTSFY